MANIGDPESTNPLTEHIYNVQYQLSNGDVKSAGTITVKDGKAGKDGTDGVYVESITLTEVTPE